MATEEVVVYGLGGYDPRKPNNNIISTTTVEVPPEVENARTLKARVRAGIGNNANYLALANPNVAQNTAQIRALTRQVNALHRLNLEQLDDVTGT